MNRHVTELCEKHLARLETDISFEDRDVGRYRLRFVVFLVSGVAFVVLNALTSSVSGWAGGMGGAAIVAAAVYYLSKVLREEDRLSFKQRFKSWILDKAVSARHSSEIEDGAGVRWDYLRRK